MEYIHDQQVIRLQGPEEIRPVRHAMGNRRRHVSASETLDLDVNGKVREVFLQLTEVSWSMSLSMEDGSRYRALADSIGSMLVSKGYPLWLEGQLDSQIEPISDMVVRPIDQPPELAV